jgi:hypothetical protein
MKLDKVPEAQGTNGAAEAVRAGARSRPSRIRSLFILPS